MLVVNGLLNFNPKTITEKTALYDVSLALKEGDFVTLIGGNGSGKSTLLNCIAGVYSVDQGSIIIDDIDVTRLSEYRRCIARTRIPRSIMGTASNMGIEENLALALRRGQKRGLAWGIKNKSVSNTKNYLKN